jgi:putative FmdB family regulatory protein
MPIYEYYCRRCNTIFSFFSAAVNTTARPDCPRCQATGLERRPSTFATLKGSGSGDAEDDLEAPFDQLDEHRLEGAMATLIDEMERAGDSEDPRQMSRLLRRFGEMTGLEPGPRMEEALRRLDAGEDVDSIESDMSDGLGDDDSFEELFQLKRAVQRRRARPQVDQTLHFL